MKRLLALILAMMMLMGCVAHAELTTSTDMAAEEPTTVPTEAPTPTAAPTEEPTAVPTEQPTEAPAEEPTAAPAEEATETPTEEPTAAPAEEATETPTEEPTAAPTEEATETPTEEPTAAPAEEATEAPTEESAWDESLCDHANENCEQAPPCDDPACWHIGLDANGMEMPLCALGRWLLDQQDRLTREGRGAMTRSIRSDTIDLDKADATIYRSGNYQVTGGSGRKDAVLTIAADRLVVLEMRDAAAGEIRLGENCRVTLKLRGSSAAETLTISGKAELHITEGGALTIDKVEAKGSVTITGGSVKADLTEKEGRTLYAFDAKDAAAVTVDGQALLANAAHADGKMYLWLKAPAEGKRWEAAMNGTALAVVQADDLPDDAPCAIVPGETNVAEAGRTYTLSGSSDGTRIVIDAEGVTLLLDNVTCTGTLVEASCAYTLRSTGATTLGAADAVSLAGSGAVQVIARGMLSLPGGVAGPAHYAGGAIVLPDAPAGWVACAVDQPLAAQRVTLDGAEQPLLMNAAGALLLPAPAPGMTYAIAADAAAVTVTAVPVGEPRFDLGQNPVADAGSAEKFTVQGGSAYADGRITASGAKAHADFRDVKLRGADAVLALANETLTVNLTGDNGFASAGDAISLTEGAALTLNVTSGRLLLSRQTSLSGITLSGNVKVEPEPEAPHTVLAIRDGSGNPVPNKAVTLRLDGATYEYITHADGTLHLWGLGSLDGKEAAVTDGDTVYTAVVMGGQGQADTGLKISGVTMTQNDDGSVTVSFVSEGAKSMGVQFVAADAATELPDAYVADAVRMTGSAGAVTITGVEAGKTLSFRVYVSAAEGAELTADTADGFQFSEVYVHHVRKAWTAEKSADAEYTGRSYRNPLKLPEGAKVSYTGKHLSDKGLPVRVGCYEMLVTIPEGNPVYLPGTAKVAFEITRIPLTIIPDPNQEKYQGETEPVFTFQVKGLMEGDELLGQLLRKPGEDVGNYAFTLEGFDAPDYYILRLIGGAPQFTILPMLPPSGPRVPGGMYEVLKPVRQEIVRADKRKVAVTLNTQETLNVNYSEIGRVVWSTEDNQPRPFSPSLTWREDTDQVLLRLLAEAELNKDGGYVTDPYGVPVWGGRYLRLAWRSIRHLNYLGVDAISFNNNGAAVTLPLALFLTEEMETLVKENGGSLDTVSYLVYVVPEKEIAAEAAALHNVSDAWKVSVTMLIGHQEIDITDQLPGATVAVDAEPVAELLTSVEMYDEAAFPERFVLAQAAEDAAAPVETAFVQPYLPEEAELSPYSCVMYTHRYWSAPLDKAGVVFAVEDAAEDTAAAVPAP